MRVELEAPDFSLRETLECGQAFRWSTKNGAYYGFIQNAAVRATQVQPRQNNDPVVPGLPGAPLGADSRLVIETVDSRLSAEAVRHYFALDVELAPILASIDVDGQIHAAIQQHPGLRILRQDPWECLASFICSSYNNIKRIQGMIERLSQAYGAPAAFIPLPFAATNGGPAHSAGPNGSAKGSGINGFRGSSFPSPVAVARASERHLRQLGLGFRAPYLKRTARLIADGKLPFAMLHRSDYWTAKTALLACDGVGDKVADCVALFGLEKYEAFPIDVWIERAMRYYFRQRRPTAKQAREFAHRHFGRYAGYAQQYLYHYVRTARESCKP